MSYQAWESCLILPPLLFTNHKKSNSNIATSVYKYLIVKFIVVLTLSFSPNNWEERVIKVIKNELKKKGKSEDKWGREFAWN